MKWLLPLVATLALNTASGWGCENREAPPSASASVSPVNSSPSAASNAPSPRVVLQLETLVQGLEMPSESDAPIRVFWTSEGADEPKAADYARMAGLQLKGDEPVEVQTLSELLDVPATEQKWMNDEDRQTARRFAALRAFLDANFAELEVLSFGTSEKQIVVVGRLEGGFAGLVTLVVET